MNQISYEECLGRMYGLGRFGIKLGLDTISEILSNLGSPEKNFKSIHIAGTNGKGSIASYIAAILKAAGFKVGLYTSPHLVRFNERFAINGIEVTDDDIVQAYLATSQADTAERKATFFELATAMALYLFDCHGVEWAVIETGMGGRLDATNILSPELSVISNLSIEHTEYLGSSLEEIAREKGGIIKHNTPVVTGVTQQNALEVLTSIARDKLAPLYRLDTDFHTDQEPETTRFTYTGIKRTIPGVETRLPGNHQLDNAAIAIAAVELLFPSPKNKPPVIPDVTILKGIFNTRWPGRLEAVMENPLVVIDGAHNLAAAVNLARYLKDNLSKNPLTLVLGILDDKDFISMLQHFVPLAHRIIFTRADNTRSIDPQILAQTARTIFTGEIEIIDKVGDAVAYAISTTPPRDSICIAGSLYVAGEARDKIFSDILC